MKRIEKINLIDRIGRELQAQMTYSEIDVYLKEFGVNTEKELSVNSKWVYVKELLGGVDDKTVLEVAEELGIEHGYEGPSRSMTATSKYWLAGHFRLFLSHTSTFKKQTAILKNELRSFGISAFVAHEDIEPTKEWQDEIERALFSMDALAAILTSNFPQSRWTDQEVGAALGRDILIIPIKRDIDPYGFIAKYQGLSGNGKSIKDVADGIFQIVSNHQRTKVKMVSAIVDQILLSVDANDALAKVGLLRKIPTVDNEQLERLKENIRLKSRLLASQDFLSAVNGLLRDRGLSPVRELHIEHLPQDFLPQEDDIPF